MNMKRFIIIALITIAGCASPLNLTQTQPASLSSPTISPTRTLAPTSTPIPFPTTTASMTPIASITPQPGFDVWDAGSVVGYYTVQFPEDKWVEGESILKHKAIPQCAIAIHGGSDVCMSGSCKETGIILGDAGFTKTTFEGSFSIYVSQAVRSWISYEIQAFELTEQCMRDGEEVLATITLRPERGCLDRAEFIKDITIPDNTSIPSGTTFTKTWRIKNTGTCTWTNRYFLVVVGRIPGGDVFEMRDLEEIVYPNQTVDISVELTAPSEPGIARWEWMLQNEVQDVFGVGERSYEQMPGDPFWVQIKVVPAATP